MAGLTTREVAIAADVPYRRLERWMAAGIVGPARPGKPACWALEQVRLVRLVDVLRSQGASFATCEASVRSALDLPEGAWNDSLVFTTTGEVTKVFLQREHGILVRMGRLNPSSVERYVPPVYAGTS